MPEFMNRTYADYDAAAVADMLNAIELASGADPWFTEDEIHGVMSVELRNPQLDSRLVFAPDGSLVACGAVVAPPPGGWRIRAIGGVHPDWRNERIGRVLLAWQFERATEIQAHEPDTAWTLGAGASAVDVSAIRLFQRFDMQPARYFLDMSAPTAAAPVLSLPDDIRIVTMATDLRRPLHAAHIEAFADHWGFQPRAFEQWAALSVDSAWFRGDLSRIALDDDEIAAYVLAYAGPQGCVYIGQIGTRQPWRRQGLASALLAATLAASALDGKTTASLTVDADNPSGAASVYQRLGFATKHSPYVVYGKLLAR
jgi:GNAT superfamily N-acetyltransferase